jgi:uncharacterized protein
VSLESSKLCLACGLCCQGAFHGGAKIQPEEIPAVRRLGLPVLQSNEGPIFPLPCPHHLDDRCTVYGDRPSPCSLYQCKLLKRYLDGDVSWEDCLLRIRQTKELVARLRNRLGQASPEKSLWQQLTAFETGQDAATKDRELWLDLASLLTLSRAHFLNRAKPREAFGA